MKDYQEKTIASNGNKDGTKDGIMHGTKDGKIPKSRGDPLDPFGIFLRRRGWGRGVHASARVQRPIDRDGYYPSR